MGLSSIAVQQREKEAKSLKSFLAFSLIGSLALHVGLLASGIFSLLSRTPDLAEEPLEVVIVEPPKVEKVKPQPEPQPQRVQPRQVQPPREQEVVRKPSPPKVEARTLPQPVPRVAPKQPVESVKPEPAPAPKPAPQPAQAPAPAVPNENVLTGVGNPTAPAISNSNNAPAPGSSRGSTVAAGPRTVRQGTPQRRGRGEGDEKGTGSGRLACSRCSQPRYPTSARRRGVEGTTQVRVNVDTGGNVTNVQIAKSSGNSDLDEAALKAVRRWKFQDLNRPRQGVVSVNFVLEGSERAQRAEERQKRREARKKRQPETANERKAPVAGNSSPSRNEAVAPRQQQPPSPTPPQQEAPSDRSRLMDALRR